MKHTELYKKTIETIANIATKNKQFHEYGNSNIDLSDSVCSLREKGNIGYESWTPSFDTYKQFRLLEINEKSFVISTSGNDLLLLEDLTKDLTKIIASNQVKDPKIFVGNYKFQGSLVADDTIHPYFASANLEPSINLSNNFADYVRNRVLKDDLNSNEIKDPDFLGTLIYDYIKSNGSDYCVSKPIDKSVSIGCLFSDAKHFEISSKVKDSCALDEVKPLKMITRFY